MTELGRHLTDETLAALPDGPRRTRDGVEVSAGRVRRPACGPAFVADADAVGGRYCEDCSVGEIVDDPTSSDRRVRLRARPRARPRRCGPGPRSSSASRSRTEGRSASWAPAWEIDRWHS